VLVQNSSWAQAPVGGAGGFTGRFAKMEKTWDCPRFFPRIMLCIQVERRATKAHSLDGTFRGRPLIPPAPCSPVKALGATGGQAVRGLTHSHCLPKGGSSELCRTSHHRA
jgi:hypothetical protein